MMCRKRIQMSVPGYGNLVHFSEYPSNSFSVSYDESARTSHPRSYIV